MDFKNGVINIQAAGYNGARTVGKDSRKYVNTKGSFFVVASSEQLYNKTEKALKRLCTDIQTDHFLMTAR